MIDGRCERATMQSSPDDTCGHIYTDIIQHMAAAAVPL